MSTTLSCACGKSYRLKRELPAGKRIPCPACKRVLEVPAVARHEEADEDPFAALMASAPDEPVAVSTREHKSAPLPPLPPLPAVPQAPAARGGTTGTSYAAMARAGTPVQQKGQPKVVFEQGWFGSVNSGVIGGLLMVVIAIAWFGAGLAADRILIYPPFLLVIGCISAIKGLFGGS